MQLLWRGGRLLGQEIIRSSLKALPTEEHEKRETNLFGTGFLEKSLENLEQSFGPGQRVERGLRTIHVGWMSEVFMAKGTSAMYSSKRPQCWQPYNSFTRFQNSKIQHEPIIQGT